MQLKKDKYYKPKDIADNGWIVNSKGNPDYYFILRHIKLGNISAKDYCSTKKNYFLIRGSEILKFNE